MRSYYVYCTIYYIGSEAINLYFITLQNWYICLIDCAIKANVDENIIRYIDLMFSGNSTTLASEHIPDTFPIYDPTSDADQQV